MKRDFEIYYTSDTHGKILPVDYQSGKPLTRGLMDIAAAIRHSGNTIVADGGDSLQGSPLLQYYLEDRGQFPVHPAAFAFNAMGLDVYTLGNHDFNFGYEVLKEYTHAMQAVCVCANVSDRRGELKLQKTWIKTLENGLRVGFTGVVTDYVNLWEKPEHLTELTVSEPIAAAKAALAELRPHCDLCICIYHGGYERDLETGELLTESRENVACRLAEETDFDILLTGHQHMSVPGLWLGDTFTVQPPCDAGSYIHIRGARDDEAVQSAPSSSALQIGSALLPVEKDCDPADYAALMSLETATESWLDETIGRLAAPILPEEKLDVALHGSCLADLFNQVMLEAVQADFACSALGNNPVGLPASVSIRSVYTAYMFANTITVKEVTRAVLKECLERCAMYLELDAEGHPYIGDTFLKPKIEHYNYDIYAGLDYAFDLTRPKGDRVVRLRKLDGTELSDTESYTLVTSDYRATGTGGYAILGACKTVYSGADNMQDMLVDYIRSHEDLTIPQNNRFAVIGI